MGTVDDGNLVLRETRGFRWRSQETEASDSRLSGTIHVYLALDDYITPDTAIEDAPTLLVGVRRVENEDGAWQGTFASGTWPNDPAGGLGTTRETGERRRIATSAETWLPYVLHGEGAYEGLTALWVERFSAEPCGWDVQGVIFDGVMPAVPEPVPPVE